MQYQTLIIDGPYLAHRSQAAPYKLNTSTNLDSTLMHTFLRSLNALRKQFNPKEIIITWESHGTASWRREMLPTYKPPKPTEPNYIQQVKDLQILLYLLGYNQVNSPKNEADDVIATLAVGYKETKLIFTSDKDIMQVVNPLVHIYNGKKIFDETAVKDKFGIYPHQIPDLLAIAGDSADNIEGVKGYGPKKATAILRQYGFIEKIPNSEPINLHRVKMLLNKRLTTLNKQASLERLQFDTTLTINSILDKYELKKIKENINEYKLVEKKSIESFF